MVFSVADRLTSSPVWSLRAYLPSVVRRAVAARCHLRYGSMARQGRPKTTRSDRIEAPTLTSAVDFGVLVDRVVLTRVTR